MNAEKFSDAFTNVDDRYVMEAVSFVSQAEGQGIAPFSKGHRAWRKWASAAACVCLVAIGVLAGLRLLGREGADGSGMPGAQRAADSASVPGDQGVADGSGMPDAQGVADSTDASGVQIPKMRITPLEEEASACMIPFFIYQGRSYVGDSGMRASLDLKGEQLGTSTGTLDAWSSQDEYVELSGSVAGDFYEVAGYDPAFLLGMEEDGELWLFVNDNNITLTHGRELFEDRLHLEGRYVKVQYQTREDWYYDNGNMKALGEDGMAETADFLSALDEGTFQWIEDIPWDQEGISVYDDKEIYHMYLTLEDGVVVHLRLFEGGYVQFDGIRGICVRMDGEAFGRMVEKF